MSTLRNWLNEGPFTLALSSSFFGFYAHCGFATAFQEQGFVPNKISGCSAGALVGAGWASGLEPAQMSELLFSVKRDDFWDPWPGLGFLRGKKFLNFIRPHFKTSFHETKIPLEVCVLDIFKRQTAFLDSGPLPEAVVASCAVPLMFHPVRIGRRIYLDGGVLRKSGMRHEAQEERILCIFLESAKRQGAGEFNKATTQLGPQHRLLRLKGLPSVDPMSLKTGRDAYQIAYARAHRAFDLPFAGQSLEA